MFLKALVDFSETLHLPPRMYKLGSQHWEIELTLDGNLKNVRPLWRTVIQTKREKGKKGKEEIEKEILGVERELPHISRNAVESKLLTDTSEYVLGKGENPERAKLYHEDYRKLIEACRDATKAPAVRAIATFIANKPLEQVTSFLEKFPANEEIDQSHVIGFFVDNTDPIQLAEVQQFWSDYMDKKMAATKELLIQTCLVTGKILPIARKTEFKIQGVPGTFSQGAFLVSAFRDAFSSYGLTQNENTPISVDALERLSKALNHLLADKQHHVRIGKLVYVYWGATETINPLTLITEPTTEDMKNLLTSAASTLRSEIDEESFHVAALSSESAGGRIIVRSFASSAISQIKKNLKTWFEAQALINNSSGIIGNPVGIFRLAAVTERNSENIEIPPRILDWLSSAAMNGRQIPREVLQKVVAQIRASRQVSYAQAVLIKTILYLEGIKLMPELDRKMESLPKDEYKMAYGCGRLMAVFEAIQWYAQGSVGANVTSKNYSSASSTPARILGFLASGAQNHLAKLRRTMPGMAVTLEKELQEIYSGLPLAYFPNLLSLQERGIFDIGYYQQKAIRMKQKVEKENGLNTETEVDSDSLASP
jgi:CRISPR-associated protein Csd1